MANVVEIIIKATDQATAQIRQVEGSLGKMQGLMAALGGPTGIAAAIGAGLTAAVMSAKSFGDEIERLQRVSKATGVELNNLRVLETIARQSGLSSTDLTSSIARLNRAIGMQDEMLKKLGITTRDPIQALMELGRMMAEATDQANKNAVAMHLLGRGGSELIGVLEELPEKYGKITAELQRLTPEQIELGKRMDAAAERWDTMWDNMVTRAKVGAATLMETIAPPGSALANFLFGTPMRGESPYGRGGGGSWGPPVKKTPSGSPIDDLGGGGGGRSLTEWASGMTQYYGLTTPEPRNILRTHPILKFDTKLVAPRRRKANAAPDAAR